MVGPRTVDPDRPATRMACKFADMHVARVTTGIKVEVRRVEVLGDLLVAQMGYPIAQTEVLPKEWAYNVSDSRNCSRCIPFP